MPLSFHYVSEVPVPGTLPVSSAPLAQLQPACLNARSPSLDPHCCLLSLVSRSVYQGCWAFSHALEEPQLQPGQTHSSALPSTLPLSLLWCQHRGSRHRSHLCFLTLLPSLGLSWLCVLSSPLGVALVSPFLFFCLSSWTVSFCCRFFHVLSVALPHWVFYNNIIQGL